MLRYGSSPAEMREMSEADISLSRLQLLVIMAKGYLKDYHSIMNYDYIFSDRKLVDYSDGDNGPPYDQNDWDYLYLPTFQFDAAAFEEAVPTIDKTFEDIEAVYESSELLVDRWDFDENITNEYSSIFTEICFSYNTDNHYQILVKNNKTNENRKIRIYAKPKLDPILTRWSLIAEGNIDLNGEIITY